MVDLIVQWLRTLLICGCICGLIVFLCPSGQIKSILKTGSTCVMLIALISPLTQVHASRYTSSIENFRESIAAQEDALQTSLKQINRSVIEQEYCAYILNEAEMQNIHIDSVEVETEWSNEGYWAPVSIIYRTASDIPESFKTQIVTQLGIANETTNYNQ